MPKRRKAVVRISPSAEVGHYRENSGHTWVIAYVGYMEKKVFSREKTIHINEPVVLPVVGED